MNEAGKGNAPELLTQAEWDMLWLVNLALHGITPEKERGVAMDMDAVYRVAVSQTMTGITFYGVELLLNALAPEEIPETWESVVNKWRTARDMAMRKVLLMDAERRAICRFMDEEGCWYVPLKGILLKELYPKLGMRQMSDNDILFDSKYQKKIRTFMEGRGYRTTGYNKGNHDEYEKEPVYNFEMHRTLFSTISGSVQDKYFNEHPLTRIPDGRGAGCHFSHEDCYVYIMAHTYKHQSGAGTGVRSLVDCYLYNAKIGPKMNRAVVEEPMKAMGFAQMERVFRSLSEKLFAPEQANASAETLFAQLDDDERLTLAQCFGANTYGTQENRINNRIQSYAGNGVQVRTKDRIKYLWKRLFPPIEFYRDAAPLVYKYKILIPFYLVYRWIRGIVLRGGTLFRELKIALGFEKKK